LRVSSKRVTHRSVWKNATDIQTELRETHIYITKWDIRDSSTRRWFKLSRRIELWIELLRYGVPTKRWNSPNVFSEAQLRRTDWQGTCCLPALAPFSFSRTEPTAFSRCRVSEPISPTTLMSFFRCQYSHPDFSCGRC